MRFTYPQWMRYESLRRVVGGKIWGLQNNYGYKNIGNGMRMTMSTNSTMTPRIHRKVLRIPSKRHPGKVIPGKMNAMNRIMSGKIPPGKRIGNVRQMLQACDNSNDSGIGIDHSVDNSNHHHPAVYRNDHINHRSNQLNVQRTLIRSDDVNDDATDGDVIPANIVPRTHSYGKNIGIDTDDTCSNDAFTYFQHCDQDKKVIDNNGAHDNVIDHKGRFDVPSGSKRRILSHTTVSKAASTSVNNAKLMGTPMVRNVSRVPAKRPSNVVAAIQQQSTSISRDGSIKLHIVAQPEQQHRARYQTEGSRGAVKDRSGNGFPIVKLSGYNKPAILQVFIGTDIGRVAPHMFYQACKVAGKNSTPCVEKKLDGTIVIEIEVKPENEMTVTCDCVGILKERNVDVEHRFPDHSGPRSKKKSTRCRMVFRATVTNDDGSTETLQVCSQQIICTQPPGVPEISKKSLVSSPATGGLELFVIGKNFLKDTRLVFQAARPMTLNRSDTDLISDVYWEEIVVPDKEYLQQTHLVCTVPAFLNKEINEPVTVQLFAMSSGKRSDPHNFVYTPKGQMGILEASTTHGCGNHNSQTASLNTSNLQQDVRYTDESSQNSSMMWTTLEPKCEIDSGMMPPPSILPLTVRRSSSAGTILAEQLSPLNTLKTELMDENSQGSMPESMAMQQESLDHFPGSNENSMDSQQSVMREMQFMQQTLPQRKQSMDIIDERSLLMNKRSMDLSDLMHDSNPYSPMHERRRLSLQLQLETSSVDMRKGVSPEHEQMSPLQHMMANKTTQMLSISPPNENNAVVTLFGNGNDSNTNIIFSQISSIAGQQQQTQDNSNSFDASLISNSNSNSSHSSMLMNPQTASNLNSADSQIQHILNNSVATTGTDITMSPETILNPTVSPTMMCPAQSEAASLMNATTGLGNGVLSGMNLISATPTTADTILSNIISQQSQQQTQAQEQDQLLKAANEFLAANDQPMITPSTPLMTEEHLIATTPSSQLISNNSALSCPSTMYGGVGDPNIANALPSQLIGTTASENVNLMNTLVASQIMSHIEGSLTQNLMGTTAITTQESMLDSVSLINNEIRKEQIAIETSTMNDVSMAQVTTAAAIPQEITNMSDMDLISYINPSTFDQI